MQENKEDPSQGRILLISAQDDPTLSTWLTEEDYELVSCTTLSQACQALKKDAFDVVFVDYMLPDTEAFEALKWIKSDPSNNIAVVVILAPDQTNKALPALELGALGYIQQPLNIDLLRAEIGRARRSRSGFDEAPYFRQGAEKNIDALRKMSYAVEQSPSTVVITDLNGIIEYVNPKFIQLSGYTPDEVIGQRSNILKSGHQSQAFYQTLWAEIKAGREWRGELHNRRKDGSLFWVFASISALRDVAGTITHFIAVQEDITARKAAEASLQKTHAELSRRLREMEGRDRLVQLQMESPTLPQVYRVVLQVVTHMVEAPRAILYRPLSGGKALEAVAALGLASAHLLDEEAQVQALPRIPLPAKERPETRAYQEKVLQIQTEQNGVAVPIAFLEEVLGVLWLEGLSFESEEVHGLLETLEGVSRECALTFRAAHFSEDLDPIRLDAAELLQLE